MLNNFSSFFEIFAALNLAYAGSDNFRTSLDDTVTNFIDKGILPDIKSRIDEVNAKIIVTMSEPSNVAPKVIEKIANLERILNAKYAISLNEEKDKFTNGFKSMFLITSFYCVALIVLGGYEASWNLNGIDKTANLFLIFSWPIFVFNLFIFFKSFTKKHYKNIKPLISILFLATLFILAMWALKVCPYVVMIENYFEEKTCITTALILAISPYILHVIRALSQNLFLRAQILFISIKLRRYLKKVTKALDVIF